MYPERDLNPYSRNGQGSLSPSCLPIPPSGQLLHDLWETERMPPHDR